MTYNVFGGTLNLTQLINQSYAKESIDKTAKKNVAYLTYFGFCCLNSFLSHFTSDIHYTLD